MSNLKDRIRDLDDTQWKEVPIPEWGEGTVLWVRTPTHQEKMDWELALARKVNGKVRLSLQQAQFRFIALVTHEAKGDGVRFFSPDDWEWVRSKGNAPIQRLFDAAHKLSGVTSTDVDELFENLT